MCDLKSDCSRLWAADARINFEAKLREYSAAGESLAEIHSLAYFKVTLQTFINLSINVVCYSSDTITKCCWLISTGSYPASDLFHNLRPVVCHSLASVFFSVSHTSQTCFFF